MDLYLFTLVLGFGGLVLMAMLGLGHGSHGGHHLHGHGHGHAGPGHGGHAHHGVAPAKFAKATHVQHHGGNHAVRQGRSPADLLGLLSPRVLFSLLFGFGVAGTLLHPLIHLSLLLLALSALAAIVFERGLIQPLWKFLLNFASQPAQTLDTLVLEEGQAATDFDRSGHGLVAVDLDGQTRQILGTLCPEERHGDTRVRTGDRLFIRAIDGARNTCTVSRLSC